MPGRASHHLWPAVGDARRYPDHRADVVVEACLRHWSITGNPVTMVSIHVSEASVEESTKLQSLRARMSATYHVAIFSKPPVAGQVKTRLIPAIWPDEAAELHHRLLRHTLRTVCQTACGRSLWIAGEIAHPALLDARRDLGIGVRTQDGVGLG